jgi:cysteine desulfurase/selenocysteine lyase
MLDGAQRAPHGPIDVQELGIDFYALSGHKTYGPTGIGILWGRHELLEAMPPFMTGGQMIEEVTLTQTAFRPPPRRFEAGTPPIAGAIGLGAALDWMQSLDWPAVQRHERYLTRRLIDGLRAIRGLRVIGPLNLIDRRGVVSFVLEDFLPEKICRHLDTRGVALRAGHHCAQPLVRSFGLEGTARASLAPYTLDADIDALLNGIDDLARNAFSANAPRL